MFSHIIQHTKVLIQFFIQIFHMFHRLFLLTDVNKLYIVKNVLLQKVL